MPVVDVGSDKASGKSPALCFAKSPPTKKSMKSRTLSTLVVVGDREAGGSIRLGNPAFLYSHTTCKISHPPVADLHSGILDARPLWVQSLSISCGFWETWQNRILAPPWRAGGHPASEILDPPLPTDKEHHRRRVCVCVFGGGVEIWNVTLWPSFSSPIFTGLGAGVAPCVPESACRNKDSIRVHFVEPENWLLWILPI